MPLRIGGFSSNYGSTTFAEANNGSSQTSNVLTTALAAQTLKLPPIQKEVSFKVTNCQNELQLKRAALMAAAAQNGIGSPAKQADFADSVLAEHKPNLINASENNKAIKDADVPGMNGKNYTYELNSQEIAALKTFRENCAHAKQLVFASKHSINARQPNSAGTVAGVTDPTAPQTLKFRVPLPKTNESLKDRALLGYIEDKHGYQKTGLWGPNTISIRNAAKSVGVEIKVLQTIPPKAVNPTFADIEISVSDATKIRELAISAREKLTQNTDQANKAARDTIAEKFTEGFFKGAWADLKGNASMVYTAATDPVGTAWKIGEAIVSIDSLPIKIGTALGRGTAELAKMTPEQRQKLVDELISKGYTSLRDMPAAEAAEKAGEIVGTIAMEAVLGKGASISLDGLKALSATKAGIAFIDEIKGLSSAAKQTIAETKVPVKVTTEVVADTAGGTSPVFKVEKKPLGEVINLMMEQAKGTAKSSEKLEMLKNGSAAGKDAITETAEQGLTEKAQSGMKHLKQDIPKEAMAQAREQLVTINVARTELIAKIDDLIQSGNILPDTKDVLTSAKNSLEKNLKQDDLVGALRDKFGKEVRRSGDGYIYQHQQEVQQGLNSLARAKEHLLTELQHKVKGSSEYIQLSQNISAIKEMTRRMEFFLETK